MSGFLYSISKLTEKQTNFNYFFHYKNTIPQDFFNSKSVF